MDFGSNISDPVVDPPAAIHRELKRDDIKIVYHPHSGLREEIISFEEWAERANKVADRNIAFALETIDKEPWQPFQSRVDYEFAEAMHDAQMSRPHVERMVACMKTATKDSPKTEFSIGSEPHLRKVWDLARMSKLSTVSASGHRNS